MLQKGFGGDITNMETLTKHQIKDIRLIGKFVEVYCAGKHGDTARKRVVLPGGAGERKFCPECSSFMEYAIAKRMKCPLEAEKPSCKHCRIHCYATEQRAKVRKIMGYAGRKLMLRGRLDYIWHYFF
jgi:hypothetical protein